MYKTIVCILAVVGGVSAQISKQDQCCMAPTSSLCESDKGLAFGCVWNNGQCKYKDNKNEDCGKPIFTQNKCCDMEEDACIGDDTCRWYGADDDTFKLECIPINGACINVGGGDDKGSGDRDKLVDKGTEDKDTEDKGTEDEGTMDGRTEDEGTEGEGTEDEGTEGEGTEDEGTADDVAEDEGTEDDVAEDEGTEDDVAEDPCCSKEKDACDADKKCSWNDESCRPNNGFCLIGNQGKAAELPVNCCTIKGKDKCGKSFDYNDPAQKCEWQKAGGSAPQDKMICRSTVKPTCTASPDCCTATKKAKCEKLPDPTQPQGEDGVFCKFTNEKCVNANGTCSITQNCCNKMSIEAECTGAQWCTWAKDDDDATKGKCISQTQLVGKGQPGCGGGSNTGAIVGGVIGALLGVALLIAVVMYFKNKNGGGNDAFVPMAH